MEEEQKNFQEVPIGVKIISVLYYISAAIGLIGSIGLFISFARSTSNYNFVIAAIFLLGFSILFFFVGRGLWRGKDWARIVTITISILEIIVVIIAIVVLSNLSKQLIHANDISSLGNIQNIVDIFDISKFIPKAIITIAINAFIAGYLLFNKKVKEAFR